MADSINESMELQTKSLQLGISVPRELLEHSHVGIPSNPISLDRILAMFEKLQPEEPPEDEIAREALRMFLRRPWEPVHLAVLLDRLAETGRTSLQERFTNAFWNDLWRCMVSQVHKQSRRSRRRYLYHHRYRVSLMVKITS